MNRFSLFPVDFYKLLWDSQERGGIFEGVFIFSCLHIKVKEIAVQAEKFFSSAVCPEGPVGNPRAVGSCWYQSQQQMSGHLSCPSDQVLAAPGNPVLIFLHHLPGGLEQLQK